MKLDRPTACALARLCRKYKVMYARAGSYHSAVKMAYSRGLRTHNGMPVHIPKVRLLPRVRVYLIWRGETEDQIKESIAYLLMLGPDEIMLIPDTITSNADIIKSKQDNYREDQPS